MTDVPAIRLRKRKSTPQKRLGVNATQIGAFLYPETPNRPKTRAECPTVRPCPYVSCRHNTYLDVTENGALSRPAHEVWDHPADRSCSLESKGLTLEEVGDVFGLTRERIRQIEVQAFAKFREKYLELGLSPEDFQHAFPEPLPGEQADVEEAVELLPTAGPPFLAQKKKGV